MNDEMRELARRAGKQALDQRHNNPRGPNAGEVVQTEHGPAFVTLTPVPCDHDFDDDSECCTKCGMSIWTHAFREAP